MFINCSNHPSMYWDRLQREEAEKYGEIVDLKFPAVPADATEHEIEKLARDIVGQILYMKPQAVMCQGEFTLTYSIVGKLKENGIKVLSACSNRIAREEQLEDGKMQKITVFDFVQFREY